MTTLAIDLGTSAIKFLRVHDDLRVVSIDRAPSTSLDVGAWLDALGANLRAHGDGGEIDRIAITGQMHGLVTLENGGYGQGIPWTDERGATVLRDVLDLLDPEQLNRLGGPLASGFQAVSLAWLKVHEPGRWSRIGKVLLPKDALIHALTGEHVTDPSDAAGTGMFDVEARDWSNEMSGAIGIPRAWLPRILPSGSEVGIVRPEVAASLGLRTGAPVIIAGGDAPVAAFGAGVTREGDALVLLSSGAQVLLPSAQYVADPAGRWYTWPAAVPADSELAPFLRSGTFLNAGNAIGWLRELLRDPDGIAPAPTRLIALPRLIGERDDPNARGAILGLRADTTGPEMRRAMLEGVAYGIRQMFETLGGGSPSNIRVGGGGATIDAWPGIIASVLGIPITRIATSELSALGAAALAIGNPSRPGIEREFEPNAGLVRQYDERYAIYREALEATRPIRRRIASLDGASA